MLRYKLRSKTVAVDQGRSSPAAVLIPSGTVLKIADGLVNASGLVDVDWEGKSVQIFAADLRERGELMSARGAGR